MHVRLLSAALWFALSCVTLPEMPLAQNQAAGSAQPTRPTQQDDRANPLVEGVIQLFIDEINRANDPEPQRPTPGGSTGNDNVPGRDDVQVADRQGPVITPVKSEFTSARGRAQIEAMITDPSGVARALVVTDAGRVAMAGAGGNRFAAAVALAPHYRPVRVGVQAWDRRQNASRTVPVTIRRVPACGVVDGVSVKLVQSVQRSLAGLGRYGGAIDGLAGPNTCGALEGEGIAGAFSWPVIAKELDWRVAVGQISLNVIAPPEATGDSTSIRVRVVDPRNTGVVGLVQMRVDGADVTRQQNTGAEMLFDVTMAEGETRRISFVAIARRTGAALATRNVTLSRPGPITLFLSGAGLVGDWLESDAAEVAVMARVEGSRKARVFFDNRSNGQRGVLEFFGTPVAIPLVMPDAGGRTGVLLWAEDGNRTTPPRRINLARVLLPGPRVFDDVGALPPAPGADGPPNLVRVISVPPGRGAIPPPLTTLVADKLPPAMASPPPAPIRPTVDRWVPVGIGIAVLIGLAAAVVGLSRRSSGRSARELPPVAPSIRVVAHPDNAPVADITGLDVPGLVLTVSPGRAPAAMMVFETDLERAAQ